MGLHPARRSCWLRPHAGAHQGQKKTTWPNTQRHSTTSVYSSMGPPGTSGLPFIESSDNCKSNSREAPFKLNTAPQHRAFYREEEEKQRIAWHCCSVWHACLQVALTARARRRQRARSAPSPRSSMTASPVSGWISCDEICRDIHGFREVIGHLSGEFSSRSLIVAIAFPIQPHTIGRRAEWQLI